MDWPTKIVTSIAEVDLFYKTDPRNIAPRGVTLPTLRAALGVVVAPALGATPVVFGALPQALSGAGVVNITAHQTNYTSTGVDDALTLADGAQVGQLKVVTHIVDGGSGVLTPANFVDGLTVTFTALGEEWEGIWTAAGWQTIALRDLALGGTNLPTIA